MPPSITDIARVCHEANRAYCLVIGDGSQPNWDIAPGWQKDSAYSGVQAIIDNPAMTPEQSHESWMAEKADAGWVWGSIKDEKKKVHPCFLAYSQLTPEQKVKDVLFQAVARALLR